MLQQGQITVKILEMSEADRIEELRRWMKYSPDPIRHAFNQFLNDFKAELEQRQLIVPECFMSYAWEKSSQDLVNQKVWLQQLHDDLSSLGIKVFLDLDNMYGDLKQRMEDGIKSSSHIILIGTPNLKERIALGNTPAYFEWTHIQVKCQSAPDALIPLLYKGNFETSFPAEALGKLIIDMRDPALYYQRLIQLTDPIGILPTLFGIHNNPKYSFYKVLVDRFLLQVESIKRDILASPASVAPMPFEPNHIVSAETIYQQGKVFAKQKEHVKAYRCYLDAANANYAKAQCVVGLMHLHGETPVEKNNVLAYEWLLKATEQGFSRPDLEYNLGRLLETGEGGVEDLKAAVYWYQKAAAHTLKDQLSLEIIAKAQSKCQKYAAVQASLPPNFYILRNSMQPC